MYIWHFVYLSSICGYLGCFHLLAILNNATGNIGIQVSVWVFVFISSGYIPWNGTGESYSNYMFNFFRKPELFSIVAVPFYISTSSAWGFQFVHILDNTCYFQIFVVVLIIVILIGVRLYLIVLLIYISLVAGDVEHLHMLSSHLCGVSYLEKCLS